MGHGMGHYIKLTLDDGKPAWVRKDKICYLVGDQSNSVHNSIIHFDNGEQLGVREYATGLKDELEKC